MRRSHAPLQAKRARLNTEQLENAHVNMTPQSFSSKSQLRRSQSTATPADADLKKIEKVAGRLAGVDLQNFMCHSHLKLNFNVNDRNCYYIVGSNGSGKSAIFAGMNIALGGKGRANDRGNSLKDYIKEGEKSAKLRVILTNEGTNELVDFDEQIIIERVINQTTSTYTIKTRRHDGATEEIKSRKKSDLDRILRCFSIELDNPLAWLSQDRSRQFLQSMKPEKLYEMFMISSELEATREIYEQISAYQEEAKVHIDAGEEKKNQLRDEYEKQLLRLKSKVKIEELEKRLHKAEWLLLWADIRDCAEHIEVEKTKLKKLEMKRMEFENGNSQFVERREELSSERDALNTKVDELRDEIRGATMLSRQHQSAKERVERDTLQARNLLKRKRLDLQTIENDLAHTRQQLDELIGNSNRDLVAEEEKLNCQKNQTTKELKELVARAETAQAKLVECEHLCKEKTKHAKNCEYELKEMNTQLERIEHDRQLYISARKDRLNLLGPDILKIKQMLAQNKNLFGKLPLGPIGEYIKMRDPKWATPVEFCLRNALNNFICNSAQDRRTLEQLCAKNRIHVPDLVVTSFVDSRVDTSSHEPNEKYLTVLRAIDIANPTVYNSLVDQNSLEDMLLLESDDEARHLMYNNPPANARQAYTMKCSQVFPRANNRPYRFYSNHGAPEARFLSDKGHSELAKRDFLREKAEIQERILQQQKILDEAIRAANSAQGELRTERDFCQKIAKKKGELESVLRQLDEENEDLQKMLSSGTVIENFKATLEENERNRQEAIEQCDNARTHLKQYEDEKHRIDLELAEAQNVLKSIDAKSRKIDEKLNDNTQRMENLLDEENNIAHKLMKCEQIQNKIEDKIDGLMMEKGRLTEKCMNEKSNFIQPEDFEDPPDFAQICETETLHIKLKELKKQKATQEQINKKDIPTAEEVEKLRETGKTQNKRLRNFRDYLRRFSDAVEIRRAKFNMLKYAMPMGLEREFREQMLMRNYNGTLHVDHELRVIDITVETHKGASSNTNSQDENNAANNDNNNADEEVVEVFGATRQATRHKFTGSQALRDRTNMQRYCQRKAQALKNLSGGERSYTTTCFIMALWSCVESPFRCLDEFDVFMDMLNRRVVMEMLADCAFENKQNQFFFFTPQGINELQSRPNIEIFNLPNVRSA